MADYLEAAQIEADNNLEADIKYIKNKDYLPEDKKEAEITQAKQDNKYRLQLNKAIANVLSQEGPDFFSNSEEMQEKKLFEALIKEGVLKDKPYEDGSGSSIVFPDGQHTYPPATDKHYLANRAGQMVQQQAFHYVKALEADKMNANGAKEAFKFVISYNSLKNLPAMRKECIQFVEQQQNNPRSFTSDSLDMSAEVSKNAQDRSIVSEEDFKGLLAARKRDLELIDEFKDNPNQRYYGEGLMAKMNPATSEITYTVDNQPVDKKTMQSLVLSHNNTEQRNNKLTAGVQYGSLIAVYNPESKDASNNYKDMKWLAPDGKGGLKEVSSNEASQIHNAEKLAGKDISAKKLEVENYGGGLMKLKNQNGASLYVNANNITHPNTEKSYNMARAQYLAQQQGGR